jgi:hypothetical protein
MKQNENTFYLQDQIKKIVRLTKKHRMQLDQLLWLSD